MKPRYRFNDQIVIRVTSADIWKSFRILNDSGIDIHRVVQEDDLTYHFRIRQKDYPLLRSMLEKRGDCVSILERSRLYFIQKSILKRPLLYTGLFMLFIGSLLLPTRILNVQVEGNRTISTRKILEAAQEAGIHLFASCAEVRSEKMKNALLSAIPELQWAGINTFGCRAVISVEERTPSEAETEQQQAVSSIVAGRDGIVESITTMQGTALCQPGQAVKRGQILISGYTDCGIYIRANRAKGEVYAKTLHTVRAVTPSNQQIREKDFRKKRALTILFGKKRINLWKDSGISDSTCGRISMEYDLTLPGGFSLPISLVCDTYLCGVTEVSSIDRLEAQNQLLHFSQDYLSSQMIAGTVSYTDEVMEARPGAYWLTRQFLCVEMIGREHLENGDPQ